MSTKGHIGFTGTQKGMTKAQIEVLRETLAVQMPIRAFHHGDCVGADAEAHPIGEGYATLVVIHPPIDDSKRAYCKGDVTIGPKPYLERNHDIVDECEVLIAAPGERQERLRSGTWATVRYAKKQGKPVVMIYPDGTTEWLK